MSATVDARLTEDEHRVVALLAEATSLFCTRVVAHGPTRDHDVNEWAAQVHVLQNRVMGQAAARAYPQLYRLLGDVVPDPELCSVAGCYASRRSVHACPEPPF